MQLYILRETDQHCLIPRLSVDILCFSEAMISLNQQLLISMQDLPSKGTNQQSVTTFAVGYRCFGIPKEEPTKTGFDPIQWLARWLSTVALTSSQTIVWKKANGRIVDSQRRIFHRYISALHVLNTIWRWGKGRSLRNKQLLRQ